LVFLLGADAFRYVNSSVKDFAEQIFAVFIGDTYSSPYPPLPAQSKCRRHFASDFNFVFRGAG
jgi:hypothetical protein